MQIVIDNIKMPIRHSREDVLKAAREIVRLDCLSAKNFDIYKQSIDARRKNNIHYVYAVTAEVPDNSGIGSRDIRPLKKEDEIHIPKVMLGSRPVIVGMGPCGLFAALVLAESGNPPIMIERGEPVEERQKTVETFWKMGTLNTASNVQFGEGGAGTFSDGKLNTRIGDRRQRFVLETFVRFGAPQEILYKAKPHIGTDILCKVIKNIREYLISLGTEIRFNSCVTDISVESNRLQEIEINREESITCNLLVLAIGHSSRDTYEMLNRRNIELLPKPFAIGVRIEHSQKFIDRLQYGAIEGLPPADYRVVYNGKERSCYSFCMCPGGSVVNASSEEGCLCVNGMSMHSRDGRNANSALVVTVNTTDFEGGILGGIEFQRKYERLAFKLGGGNWRAPVQLAEDFVADRQTDALKDITPTVAGGYTIAQLKNCMPEFVGKTLREGLLDFERRMTGFSSNGAILTGMETRTSAPLRIQRGDNLQSVTAEGLYPAGEGAGYAGGIVSAAVDGIRAALAMLEK